MFLYTKLQVPAVLWIDLPTPLSIPQLYKGVSLWAPPLSWHELSWTRRKPELMSNSSSIWSTGSRGQQANVPTGITMATLRSIVSLHSSIAWNKWAQPWQGWVGWEDNRLLSSYNQYFPSQARKISNYTSDRRLISYASSKLNVNINITINIINKGYLS